MLWVTTVALAVVVVVLLLVVGDELVRRPKERLARTADLLLSLHVDNGLALLEQEGQRSDVWWTDADPLTRREIDRTLSTWDLVAALARNGRIEQRVVVEHFNSQVVDVWELAYTYIQHRHGQQPRLWESLGDLYLDAYETSQQLGRTPAPAPPTTEPLTTEPPPVEPEQEQEVQTVAEIASPAEPSPQADASADTHQLLIAALRDIPHDVSPPPAPPAPRTSFPLGVAPEPRPRAPVATAWQRQSVTFEEVVELVPQPPTRRE